MRVVIRVLAVFALAGSIGMIPNLAAHAAVADPPYGVQVQCGGGVFSLAPDSVIPGGSTSNDFNQLVPYSQRINASCAQSVSGFGAGAAASGLANLATGALHASASASHDFIQIENGAIISTGFAQTAPGFQDQLTFTGPTDPFLATSNHPPAKPGAFIL